MASVFTLLPSISNQIDALLPNRDVADLENALRSYIKSTDLSIVPNETDFYGMAIKISQLIATISWTKAHPEKADSLVSFILTGISKDFSWPYPHVTLAKPSYKFCIGNSFKIYLSLCKAGVLTCPFDISFLSAPVSESIEAAASYAAKVEKAASSVKSSAAAVKSSVVTTKLALKTSTRATTVRATENTARTLQNLNNRGPGAAKLAAIRSQMRENTLSAAVDRMNQASATLDESIPLTPLTAALPEASAPPPDDLVIEPPLTAAAAALTVGAVPASSLDSMFDGSAPPTSGLAPTQISSTAGVPVTHHRHLGKSKSAAKPTDTKP